jgi:DNA-binding response OmpR family regulator
LADNLRATLVAGSSDPAGVVVPPNTPPARVPATPQCPKELRILVVDDMTSIRKLLTLCLQQADYQVAEAADVASASQLLSAQQIHLLIVDANLPDGSGVVLARSAQRVQPDLKVLLISGAAENDHDFDAALLKPFRMEELLSVVRSLLPRPAAAGG